MTRCCSCPPDQYNVIVAGQSLIKVQFSITGIGKPDNNQVCVVQVFVEYREAVHSPPKRHRLANATRASLDPAVEAAGDAAAQAVIDAAAAAPTAAEAAAAAEEANVAVAEAAHEVVAHAAPAAQAASGLNAPGNEDGEALEVCNRNKSICIL